MSDGNPKPEPAWKRSRYAFACFHLVSLLMVWLVFRLVLCLAFRAATGPPFQEILLAFLSGLQRDLVVALALMVLLGASLDLKTAHISSDRALNEVANNGALAFAAAAWTRHLDYAGFYKTLDPAEAYERARGLLKESDAEFVESGQSIRRRV